MQIEPTSVEPLSKKAVSAGIWVFSSRIASRGLGLIRTLVIARLLLPEDFGLLGLALISLSFIETFSQTGFQAALIQKTGEITSYLDTVWTISVIRGLLLSTILFFAAPFAAAFFCNSDAVWVIRAVGVTAAITGLSNPGVVNLQRELKFRRIFTYDFVCTLVEFAAACVLIFWFRDVWALVGGLLFGNFARTVLSYVIHPYKPKFYLDLDKFHNLFKFGIWILVSSVVVFLSGQGDDIVVGRVLGVSALGFYQMAYRLANLTATEVTHTVSKVSFPSYSILKGERERLKKAYLRVLKFNSMLSFPLASGIVVIAPEFTRTILGEKWLPMVPAMQVLAIFGLLRSIGATIGPLLIAIGKPRTDAIMQAIQLLIMAILIYPFSRSFGIFGTSIAVTIPAAIMIFFGLAVSAHNIGEKLSRVIRTMNLPVIFTVIMTTALIPLKLALDGKVPSFLFLIIILLSGIFLYSGLVFIFQREQITEVMNFVRETE